MFKAIVLAALGFFMAAIIATGAVAIRPASWPRKVLAVIPVLLVFFALAGLISALLGIGTVGNVADLPILGPLTFASGWLALGTTLAVLATVIAVAAGTFSPRAWRSSAMAMGFTSLAGVVTSIAMVAMLIIVANHQPSFRPFGNPGGPGGEGQLAPAATGAQGNRGGDTGELRQRATGGQGNADGEPGELRQGGQGGPEFPRGAPRGEGGPGRAGDLAATRQQFMAAGLLMVIFGLVEVFATRTGLSRARLLSSAPDQAASVASQQGMHGGVGPAVLAGIGVSLVALGAIQLLPVSHANPPVQSTVQWDSAQTQQLWQRACADCHSNQTQWPWYTTIAPGSWLTAAHVNSGRQSFNVSQMNAGSGFGRNRGAGEAVQQIRSGAMPPEDYMLIHPTARLTAEEKQLLIKGLQNSLAR